VLLSPLMRHDVRGVGERADVRERVGQPFNGLTFDVFLRPKNWLDKSAYRLNIKITTLTRFGFDEKPIGFQNIYTVAGSSSMCVTKCS
jgi:hypothetical protein